MCNKCVVNSLMSLYCNSIMKQWIEIGQTRKRIGKNDNNIKMVQIKKLLVIPN